MIELLPYCFYAVLGISALLYVMLDGFDLGVGILHLLARTDRDRRIFLNSIGPVWDGNEVWLVIIIGGLFAGFPEVYATVFSAFYNIFTLLMAALIFRAVAIEMRSKRPMIWWRRWWDGVFFVGSVSIAFIIGLVVGNLIQGIPLNAAHDYMGTLGDFFNAYSILIGCLVVALFAVHGCIYLILKTEGELQQQMRHWVVPTVLLFLGLFILSTAVTLVYQPHMVARFIEEPVLFVVIALGLCSLAGLYQFIKARRELQAFCCSAAAMAFFVMLFGIGTFPHLVRSSIEPVSHSLEIVNSASSTLTLTVLMIIVLIGVPLVLAYMAWIHRIFAGKVHLDESSY